ncbi:MD-2-related lipid-recognition domain-containing protein [Syncephalis plumigaleata]|nr:MD-2-related lipid-recognition domain-containing protein [Syncephalis plumigaleata]
MLPVRAPAPSPDGTLAYELCDANANYAIKANYIKLSPYPIKSSSRIQIMLSGTLNKVVEQGAMTRVAVKLGPFTKNIDINICEQSAMNNLPCPIQPGEHTITLNVDVPWSPVGGINVDMIANVKNADQSTLFCFKSNVRLA